MRKIEQEMVAAVRARRPWAKDNTKVIVKEGFLSVVLHGNTIYMEKFGRQLFSLAGWNTNTTRSRLRALGVPIHTKGGRAMLGADYITEDNWYYAPSA